MQFPCHSANDVAICGRFYRPSRSVARRHFRPARQIGSKLALGHRARAVLDYLRVDAKDCEPWGSIRKTEIHPDFTVDGKRKRLLTSEAARPTSKSGYKMAIDDS